MWFEEDDCLVWPLESGKISSIMFYNAARN